MMFYETVYLFKPRMDTDTLMSTSERVGEILVTSH